MVDQAQQAQPTGGLAPNDGVTEQSRGPLEEVAKVKETAERLANGDYPDEADHNRALAGLVHLLAEQVERLATTPQSVSVPVAPPQDGREASNEAANERRDVEAMAEEDRTPEHPPAEPLNDRTKDQA
jgi:hypothetical protein